MITMTIALWADLPAWQKRDENGRYYRLVFVPCFGWQEVTLVP